MKTKLGIIIGIITASLFLSPTANAQAPSSIAGDGFLAGISSGVFPLASYGYYLFIPANSGNSYQVIGIYNVLNSSGSYSYATTSASTARINANDSVGGSLVLNATFSSASGGTYSEYLSANPSIYQNGQFGFSYVNAPASVAGLTCYCTVTSGASPFLSSGSFSIVIASSGNTYTIPTTGQSGTYSYSTLNRSTGVLQLNDSLTGATTAYFGFSSATGGGYAIKNATGYQVGTFVLADSTPPTVSISSPATTTYSAAQTVTITATAYDYFGVARVDFYDGATFKGTDSTSTYAYDWTFTAADNGAHVWTARAYDAAGNSTSSSSVTLTVNIDTTPPTVAITSPANGQTLNASSATVSGTASDPGSPATGVSLVEVRINNSAWMSAAGTTSWTKAVSLNLGGNSIEARSRDNAGNYSLISSNFVSFVDTNKPTVAITSPTTSSGYSMTNNSINLGGTASDNVAVTQVAWSNNRGGSGTASGTASWSASAIPLQSGFNVVTVTAQDASGNISTDTLTVVFNSKPILYPQDLTLYLPFGGLTNDYSGNMNDAIVTNGVSTVAVDGVQTFKFDGTNGFLTTSITQTNPQNLSIVAWFKSTTTAGGTIVSLSNPQFGAAYYYDRVVNMDGAGKVVYYTYQGATFYSTSPKSYNDGFWHQVVATMSATSGTVLFLDGVPVFTNSLQQTGQTYDGWWRIGYAAQSASYPFKGFFNGHVGDIKVYNRVLTAADVATLHAMDLQQFPVTLQAAAMAGGSNSFGFALGGIAGRIYDVQTSTNLASTNWVKTKTLTNLTGQVQFSDPGATNKQKYYRAVLKP